MVERWSADADAAIRQIFGELLAIIKANSNGVCDDSDPECLHDFRVAVRRTRVLLSQAKSNFPDKSYRHFQAEWRRIGQLTGNLRDLDVYLQKAAVYRTMLPPTLRPAIEPVFGTLRRQRQRAFRLVRSSLRDAPYLELLTGWEQFLTDPADPAHSARPIGKLSAKYLAGAYRRVIKHGLMITPESPDSDLHELRIVCKKLRYLLEFFVDPADPAAALLEPLRRLQGNLGDHQDLSIQIAKMEALGRAFLIKKTADKQTLLAIGCLIGELYEQKTAARRQFAEAFAAFRVPSAEKLLHDLICRMTLPCKT